MRGVVIQLTPLWEHIIRTNTMPRSIVLSDIFMEFYERLHDAEWQVRQHALRVLVDVLIVMGQPADYHIENLVHPLIDNLGHVAPAVRKGALDALRVYVAQTAMPETVMSDIISYGMERPGMENDPFGSRMMVAVMSALPALILPILITPKRGYVVTAVINALANKMVKITYQEMTLKLILKIKDMVGQTEFHEYMASNVKKDFDLLLKVYNLPYTSGYHDASVDLHVPAHDPNKPWASRFVPRRDDQGNNPSSHAQMNAQAPMNAPARQDSQRYFGEKCESAFPFERTRLSNNLGTPKRNRSPRSGSNGILRSSSDSNLSIDFNGNGHSSGSESGGSTMSFQTQTNTVVNSRTISLESGSGSSGDKNIASGKVIMETEIKINPETAVTMRILEQNASTQTDDSEDENGGGKTSARRIITDFSAPYPVPVTPMRPKNPDENNNLRIIADNGLPRNGRRVRFGGEIVKMRTPDSDTVDQSDDSEPAIISLPLHKQNSFHSDNSESSDNSNGNEYIKQANVGFVNEPQSLDNFRSNIDHLKEKKSEDSRRKPPAPNAESSSTQTPSSARVAPMNSRPVSARPVASTSTSSSMERPTSSGRSTVVHSPPSYEKPLHIRISPSSSVDYSQELKIGIPEVVTVLPSHFTPPSIMIKKTAPQINFAQVRPSTSPMLSPRVITVPPILSTCSSKYNSPIKSAPTTPNSHSHSPSRRMRSVSPERNFIRRSVSSLSPRMIHREVTMMHNLQRSPIMSPGRSRRASVCSVDEATQDQQCRCEFDHSKTHDHHPRIDEVTQTSFAFNSSAAGHNIDVASTSSKESPSIAHHQPSIKSWEELGFVDYPTVKDLRSGVSYQVSPLIQPLCTFHFKLIQVWVGVLSQLAWSSIFFCLHSVEEMKRKSRRK